MPPSPLPDGSASTASGTYSSTVSDTALDALIVREAYVGAMMHESEASKLPIAPGTLVIMPWSEEFTESHTRVVPLHLDETGPGVPFPNYITETPFETSDGCGVGEDDTLGECGGKGGREGGEEEVETRGVAGESEGERDVYRDFCPVYRLQVGPYYVSVQPPHASKYSCDTEGPCLYYLDTTVPTSEGQYWLKWELDTSSVSEEISWDPRHTSIALWDVDTIYMCVDDCTGDRFTCRMAIPPTIMLEMIGYLDQTASQLNTCPSHVAFRLCRVLSSLSLADVARVVVNGRLSGLERVAGLCGLGDQLDAADIEVVESIMGEEDESQEGIV
ncbi:hypothetical protein KIPB_013105, partial [Kipferlia bialata]|eukprot:g13105.t1